MYFNTPKGQKHSISGVKTPSQIIKDYLHQHGISKTALGAKIGLTQQGIWKKLEKKDLDTAFIVQVSEALNHNFFEDLAWQFNEYANRENFSVVKVVSEPVPSYAAKQMERIIREIVRDEKKK